MPDDLVEKYKENFKDPNMPVKYQLAKVMSGGTYEDGYVDEIYDECYTIKKEGGGHYRVDFKDENYGKNVMLLHENSRPAIAPKNIFGRRKFTR